MKNNEAREAVGLMAGSRPRAKCWILEVKFRPEYSPAPQVLQNARVVRGLGG
jgi:hypothetical protein